MGEADSLASDPVAIAVTQFPNNVANDTFRFVKTFTNTSGGTVLVKEMAPRNSGLVALARAKFADQNVLDAGTLTIDYKLTINPV